jgi:Domain of unknown function (DUF4145)
MDGSSSEADRCCLTPTPGCNSPFAVAVNNDVATAAIEAEKCLSVNAFNACATMTRRAVHSLCEDRNAAGKDLYQQLEDLRVRQLITPDLCEWAHTLRMLGRDGAHPEFPEVDAESATDGVKLLREIIKYVYILPHETALKRGKKAAVKKTNQP